MDIQQERKDFADGIAEQLSNREPRFTRLFVTASLHHFVTGGTLMPRCTAGRAASASNQRFTFG